MKHFKHNVLSEDPDIQSLAALVLLTRKLVGKQLSYKHWLRYRKWFLREYCRNHDGIKCEYCGKDSLKMFSRSNDNLATLDHVIPLSKGGARFSSANIVVACYACNSRKKDNDVDEFKKNIV